MNHTLIIEFLKQIMLIFIMIQLLLGEIGLIDLRTSIDVLADVLE